MADENQNDETQDDTAAPPEPEATDAPEGVADVENLPVEDVPQGDSAEPETPEAVAEEPGLDEPPGGEPATDEPEEAPEAVGDGPAAEEPAAEEPVAEAEPAAEAPAEEPVAEAEPAEEAPAEEPVAEAEPAEEAPAEEPAAEAEPVEEPLAEEPAVAEAEPAAEAPAAEAPPAAEPPPVAAPEPKRKRKRLPRALRPARTKRVRERPAERKAITRLPKPEHERGRRQERQGRVVSAAADKTIVVRVDVVKVHPMYKKVIKRSTRLHAHDEENQAKVGDIVRVVETRPLSKLKRWRLQEIVEVAK